MPRATNGPASRRRKNRLFKQTKGNFGGRKNLLRTATETLNRGMAYAFRHRRQFKRTQRGLWITRIGIAAKDNGLSYNTFISGLKKANVVLDRKMLSGLAIEDAAVFQTLCAMVKGA